jgi:hypothetical protein
VADRDCWHDGPLCDDLAELVGWPDGPPETDHPDRAELAQLARDLKETKWTPKK